MHLRVQRGQYNLTVSLFVFMAVFVLCSFAEQALVRHPAGKQCHSDSACFSCVMILARLPELAQAEISHSVKVLQETVCYLNERFSVNKCSFRRKPKGKCTELYLLIEVVLIMLVQTLQDVCIVVVGVERFLVPL